MSECDWSNVALYSNYVAWMNRISGIYVISGVGRAELSASLQSFSSWLSNCKMQMSKL